MWKLNWLTCCIVALFYAALGGIGPASAQEKIDAPVRMAYVDFPPYSFVDRDGQPAGLSIDLARELLGIERADMEFVYADSPDAMVEMLATGQADITTLLGLTQDRLALANATQEMGAFSAMLFAKTSSSKSTIEDFYGARIGVVAQSLSQVLAQRIPFVEVVEYEHPDAQILGLLAGEVEAVVGASDSFVARLRLMEIDRMIGAIDPPLTSFPYGFFVAPTRTDLLVQMDDGMGTRVAPKDMQTLRDIWFGTPSTALSDELILIGAVVAAILVGAIIVGSGGSRRKNQKIRAIAKEAKSSALFVEAMDAAHNAIVIYDKDLRAVHWNKGFARAFPKMVPIMRAGACFKDLVEQSYENGSLAETMRSQNARNLANGIVQKLKQGETVSRMIRAENGRVFEAIELPLGLHNYASLRVDVTGLHSQAAVIECQKQELEAANDKLKVFATIAAHDLKAPLVQQGMLLQAIEEDLEDLGKTLPSDVQEYFHMLNSLSDRMKNLITGLLEHAQADGEVSGAEDVNANDRMPAILAMVGLSDRFRLEIQPNLPSLKVVATSFDAVMRNLISNAIKHHDKGAGVIKVRGRKIGNQVVFEVEDDGPGIPDEHLTSIFEPFKRLSADVEGSGLGLSFIKKTVNQWGGGIYAKSREGRGSVFVFSVPVDAGPELIVQPPSHTSPHIVH